MKNLKMNKDTYALRRKVIDLIYEIKRFVPDLPRIEVRITESNRHTLGEAALNDRKIWIPDEVISAGCLREVVYHEVLHAVYGTPHSDCPLMAPSVGIDGILTKEQCKKYFLKHAVNRQERVLI